MAADAWATAINVLGNDDGIRIADAEGISALVVSRQGDSFELFGTGALTQYGVAPSADQNDEAKAATPGAEARVAEAGCRNAGHRAIPRDPSDDRLRLWIDTQCHGDRRDVRATINQRFLWRARQCA